MVNISTNTFSISTLSEYITLIEKYKLTDFISRGEANKYSTILASAFRPFAEHQKFYNEKHVKKFYDYIGNELTEMQKSHFLALSQHCGLPTFLLDFTTSPLISLFFACYKEAFEDNNSHGYVYFINNNRLLPFGQHIQNGHSGILTEQFKDCNSSPLNTQLFNHWSVSAEGELFEIYSGAQFKEYVKMIFSFVDIIKNQDSDYTKTEMAYKIDSLLNDFKNNNFLDFHHLQHMLLKLIQDIYKMSSYGSYIEDLVRIDGLIDYLDSGAEIFEYQYTYPKDFDILCEDYAENPFEISWEWVLSSLLKVVDEFLPYTTEKSFYLPFYATYSPPNISGRVTTQNSIFICQTFMSAKRHKNEFKPYKEILVTQEIVPDYIIKIENQKEILLQLDSIGINLKSVFGDNDNIAKYIKNQIFNF